MQRLVVAGAAVGLLTLFLLPLWRIDLIAPQYPEGLGMVIRINTVQGVAPTDLQNLNELNHYIGMHAIDPASIPELRWMPWVVGALVLAGVLVALRGSVALVVGWLAACAAAAVGGLSDFYRFEYDYGHHLDMEHAIIKVPGMSYQPPLVGSKQLLNFTAVSYPAIGAWIAAVLLGLVIVVLILGRRRAASTRVRTRGAVTRQIGHPAARVA
jgi:hypothetical protein